MKSGNYCMATKASGCYRNVLKAGGRAALRLQEPRDLSIQAIIPTVGFGPVNDGSGLDGTELSIGPA